MSFDKDIVDEINDLRANPKRYADKLSKYLPYFEGKTLKIPGRKANIQTHEGAKAFQEAINYLSRQNPVEPLLPSKGLFRATQDYLKKIQRKNANVDESEVDKILDKYGTYYGDFIRGTDYGGETVEQSIINLLVSDGDLNRRQRESLLSKDYKLVGAANGTHPTFRFCTVIFQCTEFENTHDSEDIGFLDGSSPKTQPKTTSSSIKPKDETVTKYEPTTGSTIITTIKYQQPLKGSTEETSFKSNKYKPYSRAGQEISSTNKIYEPTKKFTSPKYQPTTEVTKETTTNRFRYGLNRGKEPEAEDNSRYQPRIKTKEINIPINEPKTGSILSRYQPQSRITGTIGSRYQQQKSPTSRYKPQNSPTSRYQPQSNTNSRYQPQSNTASRYQPPSSIGSRYQPQSSLGSRYQPLSDVSKHTTTTTTKYNPKTRTTEEITISKYEGPISKSIQLNPSSKYEPFSKHGRQFSDQYEGQTKSSIRSKYQPQSRAQPLSKSAWKTGGDDVYVVSEKRSEKFTVEGGKKIKHITVEKVMSDGTRNIETLISDN